MISECPHKSWSTLKTALFGSSSESSLPLLIGGGGGGGLVSESVGKAELLLANFDGKQYRDPADLPSAVSQSYSLCRQVTGVEWALFGSRFLWWHCPIGYVSSFYEEDS